MRFSNPGAPPDAPHPRKGLKRALSWLMLAAIAGFVLQTSGKALLAALYNDDFPESLAVKVELMPVIFPLHMVTGGLALVLVPAAFLLRGRPRWHRIAGRIAALDVVIAGLTAFPVALVAPVTVWSAAGFATQGLVWLALLATGIWQIRRGNREVHRAAMLMMAAATSGAVFFRIWLALWAIFGDWRHYELFYACDAWLAWTLPLGLCALLLKHTGDKRGHTA